MEPLGVSLCKDAIYGCAVCTLPNIVGYSTPWELKSSLGSTHQVLDSGTGLYLPEDRDVFFFAQSTVSL